ncbi:MAG: thermonuclease [Thermodesulfovibrio sp.]|nr:thermonuclease [Thermodesulfovibrio sp.]
MPKRYIKYIIIMLLSLGSLLYGLIDRSVNGTKKEASPGRSQSSLIRVDRVFDGDTVTVMTGGRSEKVRLIGIDAPEMAQKPWGRKSKQHLEDIIAASEGKVSIERDVVERDKYGRLLGYIRTSDSRLINEMMVRDGYAVLYTFPPNVKYVDVLTSAQREARDKKIGIWGRNGLRQEPSEYRKTHPRHY